jgi:hypothetical protein
VVEVLVNNFLCYFAVLQELHSDQRCNFKSHLIQHTLQHLGSKTTLYKVLLQTHEPEDVHSNKERVFCMWSIM